MSTSKFEPDVYVRMRGTGLNNTQIARLLGVSEASVRRGLMRVGYYNTPQPSRIRVLLMQLADELDEHYQL
jgi:predicted transcriptional regulator